MNYSDLWLYKGYTGSYRVVYLKKKKTETTILHKGYIGLHYIGDI